MSSFHRLCTSIVIVYTAQYASSSPSLLTIDVDDLRAHAPYAVHPLATARFAAQAAELLVPPTCPKTPKSRHAQTPDHNKLVSRAASQCSCCAVGGPRIGSHCPATPSSHHFRCPYGSSSVDGLGFNSKGKLYIIRYVQILIARTLCILQYLLTTPSVIFCPFVLILANIFILHLC